MSLILKTIVLTADRRLTGADGMITIDSRERLLCVYKLLVKTDQGVSVKDLQNYFRSVYGVAPDRKTLYGDLACIESHFPLKIKRDRIHNSRIMYSINP